jgi:hypothetical protein
LYSVGAVLQETVLDSGDVELDVSMPTLALQQLCSSEGIASGMLDAQAS